MAKNDEILLIKNKKRQRQDNIASNESIGVNHFTKFEKIPTAIKEKDGERLLAKTKLRKIKKSKIYDESLGTCEFSSEFNEKPKDHKEKFKKGCKHKKKHLTNDKERKVEEVKKIVHKEKIDEIYSADNDCTVEMKTKNDERLLVKTKKKKIQDNVVSDGSVGANESSEFEMRHTTKNGKDAERYLVKAKKQKIKKCKIHDDSVGTSKLPSEFDKGPKIHKGKLKKCCKQKNKHLTNDKKCNLEVVQGVIDEEKVDEISSVDTDCLNGMKKWLLQHKQSRPGLEVLQQRIDEVVTAHEEQQDQERKEREARAAEDGWTVVIHQKGRKKTTDAETGTAVGSVASAAVIDKMSKKKNKEIAMDFYRFQKREAKRNEVIMLQSKFEQDKKRIQQLRAARKFRPC